MASGSLVVRISADLNDFSRKLKQSTRQVDEAAGEIAELGEKMSVAFTLAETLAAGELVKMASDTSRTTAQMQASFGSMASAVTAEIEQLMAIVPKTSSELQEMAIQVDNFAKSAGFGQTSAAKLSESLLAMGANLAAATPGSSMESATDALKAALEGNVKGLRDFNIVLSQNALHQEAYRLHLLGVHSALTPLGTALAAYSLLLQNSTLTGTAASKQSQDFATQLAFLWRDVKELSESIAAGLIPTFATLVAMGRALVDAIKGLPDWLKTTAVYIALVGGIAGPTITVIANLVAAFEKLKVAIQLLTAADALGKFVELIKDPKVIAAILLIGAAVAGLTLLWNKFHKEVAEQQSNKPLVDPKLIASLQDLMKGNGVMPTSQTTETPLQKFQRQASEVTSAFSDAIALGQSIAQPFVEVVNLNQQALELYAAQSDKLGEVAQAARRVAIETQAIIKLQAVSAALQAKSPAITNAVNPTMGDLVQPSSMGVLTGTIAVLRDIFARALAAPSPQVLGARGAISRAAMTPEQVNQSAAAAAVANENSLLVREAALRLVDTFDAVRVAALTFNEKLKQASHDFGEAFAEFKAQGSDLGSSLTGGLQEGMAGILTSMGPMALVVEAVGKVFQGFQPVIDKLMGPLVALGQILADLIQPVLKPLFESMKALGIVVAFIGEVIYTVASGIARLIGNLIVAIGKFIAKIPFLGGIGKSIQSAGNGMLGLADSLSKSAKALDHDRTDLQNLDFNDAANGLNQLASATQSATEQLTEVPQAFKIALRRFQATAPVSDSSAYGGPSSGPPPASPPPAAPPPSGGGGYPGGGEDPNNPAAFNIILDGQKVGQLVLNRFRSSASRQLGDANAFPNLVRIN